MARILKEVKAMLITVDVPNNLGLRLDPFKNQLSDLLELGLREMNTPSESDFHSLNEILEFLARLPSPEEIIALRPSETLQQQINDLLAKQHDSGLNSEEERQWQQFEYLEHLVRIAKANALLKLKSN